MKKWQTGVSIGIALISVLFSWVGVGTILIGDLQNAIMGSIFLGIAILTPHAWILELYYEMNKEKFKE